MSTGLSDSGRASQVADPVAGTRAGARGAVAWVRKPASIQRQAAAADAFGGARPQSLELGYALVNAASPTA